MKRILLASLAAACAAAAWAGAAPDAAPTAEAKPAAAAADSAKAEIAVGEIFSLSLPCNPTTGFNWELKSIDRKIAVPDGPIDFQKSPASPGLIGAGGTCVLPIKGVKPGRTKAVLVYRRSWEKGAPAKTFTARIKVLPKKTP